MYQERRIYPKMLLWSSVAIIHIMQAYRGRRVLVALILYLVTAIDGGEWPPSSPGRFTPGKNPVPIEYEVGWNAEPVWTARGE
jgi:hypothetical protein